MPMSSQGAATPAQGSTAEYRPAPVEDSSPGGERAQLKIFGYRPMEINNIRNCDASPFVMKFVMYCTISNTPFEYVPANILDSTKPEAPKGKYPYVELPNGEYMGDSQFIIEWLEQNPIRPDQKALDHWLTDKQRARSHVARRLIEESLYWSIVGQTRWQDDDNYWNVTAPNYLDGQIPKAVSCLFNAIAGIFRRQTLADFRSQGYGRHTPEEVAKCGKDDVKALEWLCENCNPFFHGQKVSTIDAVIYAFVSCMKLNLAGYNVNPEGGESQLADCVKLSAHFNHMEKRYGKRVNDACFNTILPS